MRPPLVPSRRRVVALGALAVAALTLPPTVAHAATPAAEYVVISTSTTRAHLAASLDATGGVVTHQYQALPAATVRLTSSQLSRLQRNPNLVVGRADTPYRLADEPTPSPENIQRNPTNWGLDRIDQRALPLDQEYRYGATGEGVTVYMIDSGYWDGHDEFSGRPDTGVDLVGKPTDPTYCKAHGTHVAGIVGGSTYGVAKRATLAGVRAFGCREGGGTKDIVNAIDWIIGHAARPAVVNMSFIGSADPVVDQAVKKLYDANLLPIAAAGNTATDACANTPARVKEALTIGSTTRTDQAAPSSSTGSCVGLFAPGEDILSASFESASASMLGSGTSMAAPHVAGVAALYLEKHPNATAAELRKALVDGATPDLVTPAPSVPLRGASNRLLFSRFAG